MSVTIVLALVSALAVFALIIFVAVVVGIRSEPHNQMTTQAHRPLAAVVRRLLGVYVSKTTDANAPSGPVMDIILILTRLQIPRSANRHGRADL